MPARRQTLRERTEPELEVVLGVTALAGSNPALEQEFRSSLQVVSAAVFALDGFYGVIQEHVGIAAAELAARRANRTSRPKWVADAIFRAGRIPGNARSILRKNIITSYKVRDLAVHPEHAPRHPAVHRGLNQLVPSYVATFSIESLLGVMSTCVEAIMWVLDRPRATSGPLFELSQNASLLLHELVDPHLTYTPGSLGPKTKITESNNDD